MRILLCTRNNYIKNIAGDSVQLLKTAGYLRNRGLDVEINSGNITDYSKYDIIHLFNLTRISETYHYFKLAKQSKKLTVITPVYWDLRKYCKYTGSAEEIRLWETYKKFRREILYGCDMIYPSSNSEAELIKREYGETLPCTTVYNGIDKNDFSAEETEIKNRGKEDYIVCAARVCPRKNQLVLAQAAYDLNLKLILAGEANNKEYLNRCLRHKNVEYRGFLQFRELISLYRGAKLHVLCSFVETPGLASLEAGACGLNIVSTSEGSAEEFFEDMALYCNPYDERDIYNKVKAGLSFNEQPRLQTHIFNKFELSGCLNTLCLSYLSLVK